MAFNFFKSYYGNLYKDAYKEANNAYQQILKVNNDLNESKLTYVNAPTFKSITKGALELYQQASNNKDTYESSQLKYGIDSLVSQTLNVPVSEVAKNRNIYWKNLFNTEDEKTIFEAIGDSYRSYYVMQDIANLNNKLYNSTDQIEIESLEEQISDLEDEYARLSDPNKPFRGMVFNSIVESSAQLPNTIHSALVAAGGTTALLALGAISGVAVPVAAALAGGTIMSNIQVFLNTYNTEKGMMINDLRKLTDSNGNKIDIHDSEIKKDIDVNAIMNGGIEIFADLGFELMLNQGIIKPISDALKGTVKNTVNTAFKKTFANKLKSTGKFIGATILDTISESTTEGLENATSNYFMNEILKYSNNTIGSDYEVVDKYGFENFVNEFADGFIESIPVSATLGIAGAGFGKAINYASYKYDKVKTKRASDIYGIDFEGQKVNNEFSTVENNAFSDEKYKLVNKDIFNINPSKMSKEGKKIYNEMVIVKDIEEGATTISNEKFKTLFGENKHSTEKPEGYEQYTIKDKKTSDTIDVFIKKDFSVPKVEVDQNNNLVAFKDAESEATVVTQNVIDMVNGNSSVPIETFKISSTFDNSNNNYNKSFNDIQQLQRYIDHYIDDKNKTIEFKTKFAAEEFLKNAKKNNLAIKGSNYISDVTKSGTITFKIGDELVDFNVTYLSDNKKTNTLAQTYYALPKKLKDFMETNDMLDSGYLNREIIEESYAQDYINKSIESKFANNKTNNTQKISGKRLNKIIEAGATSLYAIYRKTGLSPESFMDMIDFRIADNGEMKNLNGLLTKARSTLAQTYADIDEADKYYFDGGENHKSQKPEGYKVKYDGNNNIFTTSDGKYSFVVNKDAKAPTILKYDEQFGSFEEDKRLQSIYNYLVNKQEKIEDFIIDDALENLEENKIKTPVDLIKSLKDEPAFAQGNFNRALSNLLIDTGIADIYIAGKGEAFIINNNSLDFVKNEEEKPKTKKKAKAEQKVDTTITDTKVDENVDTKDTLDTNLDTLNTVETAKQEKQTPGETEQETEKEKEEFIKPNTVDNYKYTITITKNANVSTIVHEAGHILRDILSQDELNKVSEIYNVDIDDWYSGSDVEKSANGTFTFNNKEYKTKQEALKAKDKTVRAEEQFANDFTMYLATATSPAPALTIVFNKIKNILTGIAETLVKNGTFREGKLNADIENLFASLLITKDDIIHRDLLKNNVEVELDIKEDEPDVADEGQELPQENSKINVYFKDMNVTNGGLENVEITKSDIKLFVEKGYYVPIRVLEKVAATNKRDFIVKVNGEKIAISKYMQLRHELENVERNLYQVAYSQGIDVASALISNEDANKETKISILEKETKSSVRPTQYVGRIVYKLLNDDKFLTTICRKITDYFVPILKDNTKLIELRKYDAVENEVTLLSKKLLQSFGDDRKSIMDLIRKNIKANPGLWAREVFRSETLFDVYQPSEETQWYYDGFLSPEQKYSNFLLKFGSDEGFESIQNDINFKDLSEEQLDKIEDKLSELDDKLGYFDSDLDNIVYIDRFNADDIKVWNAHVLNSMNRKYDVLKRSSIYNIKQLFKDINKESFKISYEQINNLLKELQNEIRKQKLNSEENIKLDEEFGRLFEYVNNDVNSYDRFMQSIKELIDNNYGFGLNEDETNLSEESLLKIKTIQKDLHDSIERMMFVHFENEQAINSLMKNLNDTVKNKELNDTIKAHEKNLSTMYKSIEKAMNKISKQQELIDNLVAENKLLNKEYATASSRLRTEYTRRYKNQITKITKLSNAYDCSIEPLMSYINYLIGNRVVVKDKNQEITDRIFSDYQDLIDNISNNDSDLYKTEDDYLQNNDMENVYETVVYSPEGEAIQNFRAIALTLNEDPTLVRADVLSDEIKDDFNIIGDSYIERGHLLTKEFPKQLYNELIKTLPYNINVNYAVERMVYHNFSEWGVDIQKALYKAVQNLKQQAKEQRQDIIKQKQQKALDLSKKMIESLSRDLQITDSDIRTYITNYLEQSGLTTDVNEMSDYEILDYFYDFDNNKEITYADLVKKYNGQNAFEIIAQDDNFRYRMLKDIISRDSRNKLTFRNKTLKSFEKLKKNATDRFRIWMSQPTLIFNYLSELSGDLAEDEFSGAFEQFFIRELLKCDNQEQLNIANRMKDSATNFSDIFGIKFEDRAKIFESTDKVYVGNGKSISLEESGLNPIRATFFNNSNNTLTKEESLLTREQVIGLYIYSKNLTTDKMTFQNREYNVNTVYSHSARNLMDVKGNNFGEEFIVDLHNNPTSYLTEKEIQWADYMIKQVGSKGNETFNLMKDLYNVNMIMEENYFPMVNIEYVNIISSKSGLTYVKPNANHTKGRTQDIYALDLNVCNTFERSIKQQEHLLAFGEWADTFNRIWKYQGNLEKTLNKVVGNELTEYVFDFSKLAANRQYFRSNNEMTFMNKVLANQSVAKVVGSLITIARQAGSLLSAQLNLKISPKEIANAMMLINKKIAGTNMTWAEYIDSVDAEMLHRKLDPLTEQYESLNKQSWIKDMPVLSKLHPDELIKLVQIADKKFAQIVWIACFNKYSYNGVLNLNSDVTKNDVLYKTIMAVRKTQSGSSIVENTKLQNSAKYGNNYIAKLIVQFQNDILKLQSEMLFGAERAWRNGKSIGAAVKVLLVPISMALFNVILNGDWIPEEDDDTPIDIDATIKDIVSELFNEYLPVAGKYVSNTIRGYGSTSFVPFADSISNLISTIAKLYNPPKGRERLDVALSGIYNIGLDVASSVGVPSEFIRRVAKMFIDVKDWEFNFNPFYFINTNAGNWLAEKLD